MPDVFRQWAAHAPRPSAATQEAFQPFLRSTWDAKPINVPAGQVEASGKYIIDGVPAMVAALLKGDAEHVKSDPFSLELLGKDRPEQLKRLSDLFDFTTSQELPNPKLVFHATARTFAPGQTVGTILSTTEHPEHAAKYLDHPTQQRRMVAFLLEGSGGQKARVGLIDQKGWNEVMIPPNLYTVKKVQQSPFGEVVTLQMTGRVADVRGDFNARMQQGVPAAAGS